MPINGISVGKDYTVTFNDNAGNVLTTRVKNVTIQQKTQNRESTALDGTNRHLNLPNGWTGTMEFERTGNTLDAYVANLENLYYNQGGQIPNLTITETITETDGTTSQFQFIGCQISLDSAGDWKGDDLTTQKLTFMASNRIQLQ